jgi:hypothetical protein
MRSGFIFGVISIVVGCGRASDQPGKDPAPPVRLVLADCTTPDVAQPAPPEASLEGRGAHGTLLDDKRGPPDQELIRRAIRRETPRFQHCYEQQLAKIPTLRGTVHATFVIATTGAVTSSSAQGVDPVVASCVDGVVKTIAFPPPVGGPVTVNYPFSFIAAGTDSTAEGQEHVAAAMPTAPVEHVPGASSPLASVRGALEACVRQAKLERGSIVLALAFGETNDATITVEGASSPAFATCLAAIKIARSPGASATTRCGFSFGPPGP